MIAGVLRVSMPDAWATGPSSWFTSANKLAIRTQASNPSLVSAVASGTQIRLLTVSPDPSLLSHSHDPLVPVLAPLHNFVDLPQLHQFDICTLALDASGFGTIY